MQAIADVHDADISAAQLVSTRTPGTRAVIYGIDHLSEVADIRISILRFTD